MVRAALEEDIGITAQYDIALAGQRAADPARAKSGVGKHAGADWARDQAGGIGADEATFNDDVGRLNQNAYAPAVINHQAAKGAAADARENQAVAPIGCAADFDQQHSVVAVGQRVGAGTGLRVAVNGHRVRDRGQSRGRRDRVHGGGQVSVNGERDRVQPVGSVSVGDRLP